MCVPAGSAGSPYTRALISPSSVRLYAGLSSGEGAPQLAKALLREAKIPPSSLSEAIWGAAIDVLGALILSPFSRLCGSQRFYVMARHAANVFLHPDQNVRFAVT